VGQETNRIWFDWVPNLGVMCVVGVVGGVKGPIRISFVRHTNSQISGFDCLIHLSQIKYSPQKSQFESFAGFPTNFRRFLLGTFSSI